MAAIDFVEDEEDAPESKIDFTPDPTPVVSQPRPIALPPSLADEQFQAQTERKADLFAKMKEARQQGEYWEGVEDRINNLTGAVVEPLSRGLAGTVGRAIDVPVNAFVNPKLPPERRFSVETGLDVPAINLPRAGNAETEGGKIAAGLYNATADLIAGLSSPNAVAMLPSATSKPVLTAWVSQMAGHQPERVIKAAQLFKEGKTQEAVQEVSAGVLELGMAEMGRRHLVKEPGTPTAADLGQREVIDPAQAQDIALQMTDPRMAQRVVLPASIRELAKEPSTTGATDALQESRPAKADGGLPEQPAVNEQLPAEKGGGEIPSGTLPPGDTGGALTAKEAGGREVPVAEPSILLTPTVRIGEQSFKGKAHPLAIGEASKKLAADAPIEELFKPESQGFTATDPATGKERFITRKEAAEIFEKQTGKKPATPDKLTSEDLRDAGLLEHLAEKPATAPVEAPAEAAPAAKPEVVKLVTSRFKNPQGDPMGTTYRATPDDYARYHEIQKEFKTLSGQGKDLGSPEMASLFKENETIKNKYGGMPPEPPAPPAPPAVQLPGDLPSLARLRITKPELRPQIDARIAELQKGVTPSASAALSQLPPVPAGHVRLFHGEGGAAGGGTGGAFYTSNIAKASTFGPDVSWVDVPNDRAQAAFAKAKGSAFPGGDNFILEPSDISRSQKIGQKVEAPVHNLDEPAPAPRGIAASARQPGALKGGESGAVSLAPLAPIAKQVQSFVEDAPGAVRNVAAQLAGKSAPKTSNASEASGNALVRYASAKIAAPLVAKEMATEVLGDRHRDADFSKKLGAVLVEDRLRGIKDAFKKAGNRKAARAVNSIVGQADSPFATEAEFKAALRDPEIRAAIDRHKRTVQPTAEAAHEEAGGTLAGPGLNTGAFVNLKAIFEGGEENLLAGGGRGNLMNPLRRPSRFSKTAAGTAEKYETDYRTIAERMIEGNFEENTKRKMYDQLVDDGLAVMNNPGDAMPEIGGKKSVKFVIERKGVPAGENKARTFVKNLWVREDIAPEVRQALNVDGPIQRSGIVAAANLLNRIQLAGPTDAVWHVANGLGSIAGSQGGKNVLIDIARKIPGVNLLDAMGRTTASAIRVLRDAPEVQKQLAELGTIGAGRAEGPTSRLTPVNAMHKIVMLADRSMRLARDDMYKNLVRRGWVTDTEVNRREWVNQMGQYNPRLMGQFQRFFKEAGFSPFVVAGRNFNRMAMRRLTLDPGVKAASPAAWAQMRAVEFLGTAATLAVIPSLINYLTVGNPNGRPGTKMGQIDTGKDDNGKHVVIDPAQWTGLRRGLRISGIQAVTEGVRRGDTKGRISQEVIRDIMGGIVHPWAGPAVTAGSIAATGYSPGGYKESENPKDYGENIKTALEHLNPLVNAWLKGKDEGTGSAKQLGLSLGGAAGFKEVKPFTAINNVSGLHQAWLANNKDPKVKADYERNQAATFPVTKYKALDQALAKRDQAGAIAALADLKAEGQKNKEVMERMRPFVGQGANTRVKPLFHESHKLETAFRNSLSPEERKVYQDALKERAATWREFLKAWRKRGSATTAAPKIDFVPD